MLTTKDLVVQLISTINGIGTFGFRKLLVAPPRFELGSPAPKADTQGFSVLLDRYTPRRFLHGAFSGLGHASKNCKLRSFHPFMDDGLTHFSCCIAPSALLYSCAPTKWIQVYSPSFTSLTPTGIGLTLITKVSVSLLRSLCRLWLRNIQPIVTSNN